MKKLEITQLEKALEKAVETFRNSVDYFEKEKVLDTINEISIKLDSLGVELKYQNIFDVYGY